MYATVYGLGKLFFIYLIILAIQAYVVITYTLHWKEHKKWISTFNDNDPKERNELEKVINDKIQELKKKFEKESTNDFINYLLDEKNRIFEYKGNKLYIFMWEKVKMVDGNYDFISNIHVKQDDIGVRFSDLVKKNIYQVPFNEFKPENVIADMLYSLNDRNINDGYKYYWYDPIYKELVQKKSFAIQLKKKDYDGFIGAGFNIKSISKEYSEIYYENIYKDRLYPISFFMFIGSFLVYSFIKENNFWKVVILFLLIPNIYILYYLNITEDVSSIEQEESRLKAINDGVLSISFLVSVNIFILNSLASNKNLINKPIFLESSVIFSLSLLLLLFSIYKQTNFNSIADMKSNRITKQLTFNLVVYYNLFIVINYLLFIAKENQILKLK